MIWKKSGNFFSVPLKLFALQLTLNFIWSPLFFGLKNPAYGLIDIIALWLALVATIFSFWTVNRAAALIMIPYLLWVSFATALNYSIWQLN